MKNFLLSAICLSLFINSFSQDSHWAFVNESTVPKLNTAKYVQPQLYKTLTLDFSGYKNYLNTAPKEFSVAMTDAMIINIPYPDNSFQRFKIVETKMMEDGLAAQLPGIKTFVGQGIDDPYATIRMDYTYQGFHAFIMSPKGNVFIDPYERTNKELYMSYYSKDYFNAAKENFVCKTIADPLQSPTNILTGTCIGTQLKTYRLALACTGEYAVAVCSPSAPTIPLTASAMLTSVNRVTGVYEKELSIRLVLVANNNNLIYLDGTTDPYTNNNGSTMLGQNQTNITTIIGSANYDIGHVFSTGGGGIAGLGVVCTSSQKARGVTGSPSPVGDGYDIDYVAHEMGHQFGGNHTFESQTSNCGGGNRNKATAYEVGSGTTIMAYAGICGTDDIQPHSDPYFHTKSFDEITAYTTTGGGAGCPVVTATGNTLPTLVMPTTDLKIPLNTPFVLTATGADANGDAITFNWEEWDITNSNSGSAWNSGATSTTAPLFKPRIPLTTGTRYFPALPVILAGYPASPAATMGGLKGETLPGVARDIKFRLTVRDNRAGGGGVVTGGDGCSSTGIFKVTVTNDGPFILTNPNTAVVWASNSTQTVTWNVANTNSVAGINCQNVDILLSTDGGNTYPITVLANTPNDGTQTITVPSVVPDVTTARFMIRAVGNVFFDISDVNFTITQPPLPVSLSGFRVSAANASLVLNWRTSSELNNKGFVILRSEGNATDFTEIGFINGAGTSNTEKKYSITDRNIRKGVDYFYKLKQVDLDGHFAYSTTERGKINEDGQFGFVVSPNPVSKELTVLLNGLVKEKFNIVLVDMFGRNISSTQYDNDVSGRIVKLDMSGLAAGMYIIKVIQDNKLLYQKVMKQ